MDHSSVRGAPQVQRRQSHGRGTTPRARGSTLARNSTRSSKRPPAPRGALAAVADTDVRRTTPACVSRGALTQLRAVAGGLRTTPACAGSTRRSPRGSRPCRDHPRVRGEHTHPGSRDGSGAGPPPRARGAQQHRIERVDRGGTTPACAGSTAATRSGSGLPVDHPPRARGAPATACRTPGTRRTTPACAGSTRSYSARTPAGWDHPRVRGEHMLAACMPLAMFGPPPRARGARPAGGERLQVDGTTPACAGSTGAAGTSPSAARDHPRVRGEHCSAYAHGWVMGDHPRVRGEHTGVAGSEDYTHGPPPRARGARARPCRACRRSRTTPACAGSTLTPKPEDHHARDHPRVRGEHLVVPIQHWPTSGPPPRARGARQGRTPEPGCGRTTPACAGSTSSATGRPTGCGDHPRVRGEHCRHTPCSLSVRGPPPRARGAPRFTFNDSSTGGTTPACAGSTRPRPCR